MGRSRRAREDDSDTDSSDNDGDDAIFPVVPVRSKTKTLKSMQQIYKENSTIAMFSE